MTFRAGDIVVVRFPFAEGKGYKWRPGLIVTTNAFNKRHGVCWVMMITTQLESEHDVPIAPTQATGLREQCYVRPHKLAAIDCDTMRLMGHAPSSVMRKAIAFGSKVFAA